MIRRNFIIRMCNRISLVWMPSGHVTWKKSNQIRHNTMDQPITTVPTCISLGRCTPYRDKTTMFWFGNFCWEIIWKMINLDILQTCHWRYANSKILENTRCSSHRAHKNKMQYSRTVKGEFYLHCQFYKYHSVL